MISRRHFVQAAMATTALYGASGFGNWSRLAAQQALSQDDLIGSSDFGNVSLIHITDIHAQTQPIYFREPEFNIGVGLAAGQPPHLVGDEFRAAYGIEKGSAMDYALTYDDFTSLARTYGRMGGLDRISTVVKAIRAERPDALLLDGGDTWQGSLPSLRTRGMDMVTLMNALGVDAMTSHWEFTLGSERVNELVENHVDPAFLGANIFDVEWDEPVYDGYRIFERNGTAIGVIGQAFPYMPIANPGWMFPELSFGLRRERIAEVVQEVRDAGAEVVVLLSHNGFDVDRQFAMDIPGIDVILTGHTHDALPEPLQVGNTFLVASGSHGKFVSRVDLDVQDGAMRGINHRLIPIFSDVIAPDPEMTALVDATRAPFEEEMNEVIGTSGSLLFRRGNFNGTWDDVICDALISQRDAQIALSPGFRWGGGPAGAGDHARGHLQRHRDDLSQRLSHRDVGRDAAHDLRGRGRQHLQPRRLLPAGRRHGAHRRPRLPDRYPPGAGQPHHRHDASQHGGVDHAGSELRRGRLGQRQRRHRRPAHLGGSGGSHPRTGHGHA